MANVIVRRISGKQFVGIDSTNHSVVLSTAAEGVGVKPSDMLLVSLASCTAVDVVEILEKKKINPITLEIVITAEQDQDPPWTFRKIHLLYKVKGEGLSEKALQQAIHLSETKYCSVAATIRGIVAITTSYEIL